MSEAARPPEESPKVPVWIITFSDMVSLLMTFFVLLVSLGHTRDNTLFDEGDYALSQVSFLEGVKYGFGIHEPLDLGSEKLKYLLRNPDESYQERTPDAREEMVRRALEGLGRAMQIMPSHLVADATDFALVEIAFPSGQATLNDAAREELTQLSVNLQNSLNRRKDTICIIGLASGKARQQQWMLSARRAQAVADFLQGRMSDQVTGDRQETAWRICWWGAGPGADWAGQESSDPTKSRILIAVLKTGGPP